MTSRPTRSSSIPIPRSSSMASSGRNISIETAIPITFTAGVRPRIPNASSSAHRISLADDQRGLGIAQGIRGSSSLASSSPIRTTARSFTHTLGMPSRTFLRSPPAFEPRIIRAEAPRSPDVQCSPSTSTSPSRPRRLSGAGARAPSTQRLSPGHTDRVPPPPPPTVFPRPAYLEHSALRHLLQTEAPPSLPPARKVEGAAATEVPPLVGRRRTSMSPSTDSDEESNVSPPREMPPTPLFSCDPILRLPTRWSDQVRHPLLTVSIDGRDLTYHGPSSSGEKDAAAARTAHPIPSACGIYYYEVNILSKGQKGHISIGFAARDVRLSRLPGWEKNSWGYHGDDGYSFAAERNGTPYGPIFGTGDVIGCGIDFSQSKVFYTKNGTFLGPAFDNVGKDCDVYPSVGLRHTGEAVRVNFGHEAFKFDIEYHVQQQRSQTWNKIQSTSLHKLFVNEDKGAKTETSREHPHISEEKLKGPINQLVLSYLAHHGYAKTARAFQAQCERQRGIGKVDQCDRPSVAAGEDHDIEMDDVPSGGVRRELDGIGGGVGEGDIELRTRIVNAVIAGDIDTALSETRAHHPAVLEQEAGLMLFKLRCRKFVELILEAAEMKKRMRADEEADEEEGMLSSAVGADGMDVDDDALLPLRSMHTNGFGGRATIPIRGKRRQSVSPGRAWSGVAVAPYENALRKAISYGQTLDTDYKVDRRPDVRSIFTRTFAIVACDDPVEAGGEVAEVAGHDARVTLANELNQAILKSQGRPEHPALEMLYRQTSTCIVQLGLSGVGAAAFADMPKEFLDA